MRALLFSAATVLVAGPASAGTYHAIFVFDPLGPAPGPHGSDPLSGLAVDPQGRLYGTTAGGGAYDYGTVYRLTRPAAGIGRWTEEILYSFTGGSDGRAPASPVTLGSDGTIYGSSSLGASYNRGVIFKIANTAGFPFTILHTFTNKEGGEPQFGMTFGADGLLYGSTRYFGTHSRADTGELFSISPVGDQVEYRWAAPFGLPGDGLEPEGQTAVPAAFWNGFVGSTSFSNAGGQYGTVFAEIIQLGGQISKTTIHTFTGTPDLAFPVEPLVVGTKALKKSFFGCALEGGQYNNGGVYEISPNGQRGYSETVIYSFGTEAGSPAPRFDCSLIQADPSGVLYGTTGQGGLYNDGTFFKLTPPKGPGLPWTESVDVNFGASTTPNTDGPLGLLLRLHGRYYGVAGNAVYELTP